MSKITRAHLKPLLAAVKLAVQDGAITVEEARDLSDEILYFTLAHRVKHFVHPATKPVTREVTDAKI